MKTKQIFIFSIFLIFLLTTGCTKQIKNSQKEEIKDTKPEFKIDAGYTPKQPILSPDEKHIAVNLNKQNSHETKLFVYNIESGETFKIETYSFEGCGDSCYSADPFWSPDSQNIGLLESDYDETADFTNPRIVVFNNKAQRVAQYAVPERHQENIWDVYDNITWVENNEIKFK